MSKIAMKTDFFLQNIIDFFVILWYFLNAGENKSRKDMSLCLKKKDEINILREKLDRSIINGDDYSKIYKLSTKLDKLVADYYKDEYKNEKIYR